MSPPRSPTRSRRPLVPSPIRSRFRGGRRLSPAWSSVAAFGGRSRRGTAVPPANARYDDGPLRVCVRVSNVGCWLAGHHSSGQKGVSPGATVQPVVSVVPREGVVARSSVHPREGGRRRYLPPADRPPKPGCRRSRASSRQRHRRHRPRGRPSSVARVGEGVVAPAFFDAVRAPRLQQDPDSLTRRLCFPRHQTSRSLQSIRDGHCRSGRARPHLPSTGRKTRCRGSPARVRLPR